MKLQRTLLQAFGCVAAATTCTWAGPIVVTPGSLSSYVYYPPAAVSGGSASGGAGEEVSTLQRCLWTPSQGDQTVTVNPGYDYQKDITVYYRLAGGNGGSGYTGGGGGSSAILQNGARVAVGRGGDGNARASEVSGVFKVKAGDTLRFVTGGGGGDGLVASGVAVGGGGGAGFAGGGGGGSLSSRSATASDYPGIAGKGGGDSPGAGGYASGSMAGTAGINMQGGVGTYPDGSSAPYGTQADTYNGSLNYYSDLYKYFSGLKFPATATMMGAPIGSAESNFTNFGGGGGKLASGGAVSIQFNFAYCQNATSSFTTSRDNVNVSDNGQCYSNFNRYNYVLAKSEQFPQVTSDLALTRKPAEVSNGTYQPINVAGGSLPGQIATMYQAPVCGIFK
ncbi:hypothetical protein AVME950_00550 [Acidovorax sp. SUPP950]|uniref:hypothetical protein n=1 Tax=Acidovorax sp. SUPP950 TaxID=511901 RepID=UPI0023D242D3|nr:hypothetical protein [Acidovorax sp. SUPP950]GKS73328.1 hypothetical protein AVME950_00550 [Acidovorax sp. SUPP950]